MSGSFASTWPYMQRALLLVTVWLGFGRLAVRPWAEKTRTSLRFLRRRTSAFWKSDAGLAFRFVGIAFALPAIVMLLLSVEIRGIREAERLRALAPAAFADRWPVRPMVTYSSFARARTAAR
jgi:hypothetical protein